MHTGQQAASPLCFLPFYHIITVTEAVTWKVATELPITQAKFPIKDDI